VQELPLFLPTPSFVASADEGERGCVTLSFVLSFALPLGADSILLCAHFIFLG